MNFASCDSPPLGMEVGHLWKWWQNPTSNKSSNGLTLNTIQFETNKTPNIVHSHSPPETWTLSFCVQCYWGLSEISKQTPFQNPMHPQRKHVQVQLPQLFFNPQPYPHLLHWNQWISQIHGRANGAVKGRSSALVEPSNCSIFFSGSIGLNG